MMHVWFYVPDSKTTWKYQGRMTHAQVIDFVNNSLPDSQIIPGLFAVPGGVFYFILPTL